MIKGWICQEDITVFNVCAPNIRVSKYMQQKLTELNEEIDKSTTDSQINSPQIDLEV